MTEKKERRKYTKEFKIEAVELARSHGGAAAVIARDLAGRRTPQAPQSACRDKNGA